MKFEPIGDIVVMSRELIKEQDGISLPEESWTYKMVGTVVAVGPGMLRQFPKPPIYAKLDGITEVTIIPDKATEDRMPMQVKVGDTVLCPMNTTIPISPKRHENLFYCREGMLMAILHPEDDKSTKNGKK